MGWLIFFGVIASLALLPLGVWIRYDESGPLVRVVAGPVKITLVPKPKKVKKKTLPAEKKSKKQGKQNQVQDASLPKPPQPPVEKKVGPKPKGGSITDFLPLVKVGLDLLGNFRRKLRLDDLYLRLILASSDPCDLAVNYGRTWAAVGNLIPQLERLFVIKKRDIEVECDFTATQTLVVARLEITITLGRLLSLLAVYGFRGLKEFLKFKKKRKGGAVT